MADELLQHAREAARRARLMHDQDQQEVVGIPVQEWQSIASALRAAPEVETLSESDKEVALAQAVELAQYVEKQAKGGMREAAARFLSLSYAQDVAKRLRAAPEVPAARVTEPLRADESRQEQADAAIYNRGWNDCRDAMLATSPKEPRND